MAITLRANKGTQLTYNELDTNFVSVFYSASITSNQQFLNLHYTGSSNLGVAASSVQIPLNPYTGSNVTAAGQNTQIQFNNSSAFGGSADLTWNGTAVSIGQSIVQSNERLAILGGDVRIESNVPSYEPRLRLNFDSASLDYSASIKLDTDDAIMVFENESTFGSSAADSGMTFVVKRYHTTPTLQLYGTGKIGMRNANIANGDVNISGSLVIDGNAGNINRMFRIRSVDSSASTIPFTTHMGNAGNSRGVVLDGPDRGHVIVGLQSSALSQGASQTFSILSGPPTSSNYNASYNSVVAMFKANGQVGIGTHTVAGANKLHVAGAISGSSVETNGAIKAGGNISGSNHLYVSKSAVLSGSVTINTVPTAGTATDYDFLVVSASQVVAQVNAAPIPVGGIIMWSGNVASLPAGFALCDGSTVNGTQTPDLSNRFILGSSNASGTPTSNLGGGSPAATGGTTSHNHGGVTGDVTLNINQIPSHGHTYKDGYYMEISDPGQGHHGTVDGADFVGSGSTRFRGSGESDNDNKFIFFRNMTTNGTGGGQSHNHSINTNVHIPTFYSLAFIMFVGT